MLLYFEFEVNWLAASAAAPCCALRSINISNFNPTVVQCSIYPPACCLAYLPTTASAQPLKKTIASSRHSHQNKMSKVASHKSCFSLVPAGAFDYSSCCICIDYNDFYTVIKPHPPSNNDGVATRHASAEKERI